MLLYQTALKLAARIAGQTGKPQFVVGRDDRWAFGNFAPEPIEGFFVQQVVAPALGAGAQAPAARFGNS